jgi:hypothetical protein
MRSMPPFAFVRAAIILTAEALKKEQFCILQLARNILLFDRYRFHCQQVWYIIRRTHALMRQ